MISINASTTALVAQNDLNDTQNALSDNMLQLSTGKRINSAADDAAGLQITNRMETQISSLDQAQRNATDATSIAQTAEGAMQEVTDILNRMNDLAVQASSDTASPDDRKAIDQEVQQLEAEIKDISEDTNFAGEELFGKSFTFQVGTEADDTVVLDIADIGEDKLGASVGTYDYALAVDGTTNKGEDVLKLDTASGDVDGEQTITLIDKDGKEDEITFEDNTSLAEVNEVLESEIGYGAEITQATTKGNLSINGTQTREITTIASTNLGGTAGATIDTSEDPTRRVDSNTDMQIDDIDMTTRQGAANAQVIIEGAMKTIDEERAELGAFQNRMDSKIDNMANIEENMSAAQSQMLDADFAQQTTEMTSNQMLMQSGASVLSQAKTMPQYATQLMG